MGGSFVTREGGCGMAAICGAARFFHDGLKRRCEVSSIHGSMGCLRQETRRRVEGRGDGKSRVKDDRCRSSSAW